jgi:adenylate kinase family enzyme
VRMPDDILVPMYKTYLSLNTFTNRGFALDGWPKTYSQCQQLFYKTITVELPQEETEEGQELKEPKTKEERVPDDKLMPDSIISFNGEEDMLKARIKEKDGDEAEERFSRRYKAFKEQTKE